MNAILPIAWFAMLAGAFFIFIVLPQRRKMAAFHAMQGRLAVGDRIVTTSGMHGLVVGIDDDQIEVEIAPGTVVRFFRGAIGEIVGEPVGTDETTGVAANDGEGSGE